MFVVFSQMDPERRPAFTEITECLQTVKDHRLASPHTNPIAAKSHIAVGHVRRHIYKFSKGLFYCVVRESLCCYWGRFGKPLGVG